MSAFAGAQQHMANRWYVAAADPQREKFARDNLIEAGFDAFLPLERSLGRDRNRKPVVIDRPLFVGYLLVALSDHEFGPARRARGIRCILPLGREAPLPIRTAHAERLIASDIARSALTLDDLLGHNRRGRRIPQLANGEAVRMTPGEDGLSYSAIVKADMGERIKLLIGSLEVEVGAEKVRAA
jgi:hypothetical protein